MPEPARSLNGRNRPNAGLAEKVRQLELDAQQNKSDLASHEKLCLEHAKAVETSLTDLKTTVDKIATDVTGIMTAQLTAAGIEKGAALARKPKWWVMPLVTIVSVVLAAALAAFGWMAGRIMSDNDRRIDDAARRPADGAR